MCWYCTYGWPESVADIYDKYAPIAGAAMHWGPSHVVWEDENFGDDNVKWCLAECKLRKPEDLDRFSEAELASVQASLEEMLAIPESVRHPAPEDEETPPPPGLRLRHVWKMP